MGFTGFIKKMDSERPIVCPRCGSELREQNMPAYRFWECVNPQCPYFGGIPARELIKIMDKGNNEND